MFYEQINIYTDGSCCRLGLGGWGFRAVHTRGPAEAPEEEFLLECYGGAHSTTNNRMEMEAVRRALAVAPLFEADYPGVQIVTHSDSVYVVAGLLTWIHTWRKNGWVRAEGPVRNEDLWKVLYHLYYERLEARVGIQWIKGHSNHPGNDRADFLAGLGRRYYLEGVST